jgi:hypothetical protein
MNTRHFIHVAIAAAALAGLAAPIASAQDTSDPFSMPARKKPAAKPAAAPPAALEITAPPFAERAAKCRAGSGSGAFSAETSPCPYLVSELKLMGVFATAEGTGAFVQTKASGQTFVIKPGDALFDGRVESVRQATTTGPAAVVFTQTRRLRAGKAVRQVHSTVTMEQQ